jgi:ribosome biogenesis GTPase
VIGRIFRIAGTDHEVRTPEGVLHCRFSGKAKRGRRETLKLGAVGDEVEVVPSGSGEGVIQKILPRRSKLSRHDVHRPQYEQVIVANVDVLVAVQSAADPDWNPLIADQCTVMAAANALPCLLVVNKTDLARPDLSPYERAGYEILRTSARTGEGIEALRGRLKDRTSVFLGPSGVGKSSLLNALDPSFGLKVGEVSRSGEGRHTTTWVELRDVAGGRVADTPGLEFFTLWGVTPANLKDHFLEFAELAAGCRWRNCSHLEEEGCAVRGKVEPSRWESYRTIRDRLARRETAAGSGPRGRGRRGRGAADPESGIGNRE